MSGSSLKTKKKSPVAGGLVNGSSKITVFDMKGRTLFSYGFTIGTQVFSPTGQYVSVTGVEGEYTELFDMGEKIYRYEREVLDPHFSSNERYLCYVVDSSSSDAEIFLRALIDLKERKVLLKNQTIKNPSLVNGDVTGLGDDGKSLEVASGTSDLWLKLY